MRAVRWIAGTDRRQAEAQAQAGREAQQRAEEEQKRRAHEAEAARQRQADQAAQARAAQLRIEQAAAQVRAVENSDLPLVSIQTASGRQYYARREAWLAARKNGDVNLPLCTFAGEPIEVGPERTRLRMSNVGTSVISPAAIVLASEYLPPEDVPSPRLGMEM